MYKHKVKRRYVCIFEVDICTGFILNNTNQGVQIIISPHCRAVVNSSNTPQSNTPVLIDQKFLRQ